MTRSNFREKVNYNSATLTSLANNNSFGNKVDLQITSLTQWRLQNLITHAQQELHIWRPQAQDLQQSKKFAFSQQSGPISNIIWTDSIFIRVMVLNLKIGAD